VIPVAPRPANPPADRRQEILRAALRVFALRGYTAATNAEIAREAGVTAAALYYYFPSKLDLFKAALSERQAQIMPTLEQVGDAFKEMPPHVVLPFLIQNLVRFFSEEETQALLRIVLAEGPRNPDVAEIWGSQVIAPAIKLFFGYAQHHMDLGTIRRMDPRAIFLMIQGPVLAAIVTRDLLKLPMVQDLSNEMVAQQILDTVLPGFLIDLPKE
jgi:AcrR family transcriptional regulator